jgi:hypothetical protein
LTIRSSAGSEKAGSRGIVEKVRSRAVELTDGCLSVIGISRQKFSGVLRSIMELPQHRQRCESNLHGDSPRVNGLSLAMHYPLKQFWLSEMVFPFS